MFRLQEVIRANSSTNEADDDADMVPVRKVEGTEVKQSCGYECHDVWNKSHENSLGYLCYETVYMTNGC